MSYDYTSSSTTYKTNVIFEIMAKNILNEKSQYENGGIEYGK